MNPLQQAIVYSGLVITSLTGSSDPQHSGLPGTDTSGRFVETSNVSEINASGGKSEEVAISPNPNNGYFVLTLPPALAELKGTFQITDLMGHPVYTSDYFPEHGNKVSVEMLGTKPGVHFLVVSSGTERLVTKFIIN